jgi:hypothetical protein
VCLAEEPGWEAGIRAESGERSEPIEAWSRAEQPTNQRSERSWLGVWDDFRNYLIAGA